jgi:hypothetical protein
MPQLLAKFKLWPVAGQSALQKFSKPDRTMTLHLQNCLPKNSSVARYALIQLFHIKKS